jgi:hypothetical protein
MTASSRLPPTAATRSLRRTPVHEARALQPSTQTIDNDAVQAGRDLEHRRGHEHHHAQALQAVRQVTGGRPAEELRIDRPDLRTEQRHDRDAGSDVQALRDAVEADRARRLEEPARRMLDRMADIAGEQADSERDAEHQAELAGQPGKRRRDGNRRRDGRLRMLRMFNGRGM